MIDEEFKIKPIAVILTPAQQDELRMLLQSYNDLRKLVSLLTVKQVIEAGNEYINVSGLNPWCMNEGSASGDEKIVTHRFLSENELKELWTGLSL